MSFTKVIRPRRRAAAKILGKPPGPPTFKGARVRPILHLKPAIGA